MQVCGVGFVIGIWQAPWIEGMMTYWFDKEVMSSYAYEYVTHEVDLKDHQRLFWTPASGK